MLTSSPPPRRARPAVRRQAPILGALALTTLGALAAPASGARPMPPYAPGYPMLFPRPVEIRPRAGSVVAADLERDGRMELIAAIPAGMITLVDAGVVRPGWPRRFNALPSPAYPVGRPGVGDLDGDGVDEVAVCVSAGPWPRKAFLYAIGADGSDLPGWPIEIPAGGPGGGCAPGATLVADLDGDGRAEVARALVGGAIVLEGDGTTRAGWPYLPPPVVGGTRRTINADMVAADVNGDRRLELLFVESGYQPRLFAVDADGRPLPHFPAVLDEVIDRQAPAADDLDGDGTAEMVQSTLPFDGISTLGGRRQNDPPPVEGALRPARGTAPSAPTPGPAIPAALHLLRFDATETPGWPVPLGAGASYGAQIVRLDGERGATILQGDGDRLDAYDTDGVPRKGFPIVVHGLPPKVDARQDSRWTVGDFDGDGRSDFLRVLGFVEAGNASMSVIGMRPPNAPLRGFPFSYDGLLPESDLVSADLDGDGDNDLALLVGEGTNGGWRLLVWGGDRKRL